VSILDFLAVEEVQDGSDGFPLKVKIGLNLIFITIYLYGNYVIATC